MRWIVASSSGDLEALRGLASVMVEQMRYDGPLAL